MRRRVHEDQSAPFQLLDPRNKGTCAPNLLTIRRDMLEATVQDALRHRLMDPELYTIFVTEFTAEWNRLQADCEARAGG